MDLVDAGANEIEGVDFDVTGKPDMRAEAPHPRLTSHGRADRGQVDVLARTRAWFTRWLRVS